jgi:hypothetical protein
MPCDGAPRPVVLYQAMYSQQLELDMSVLPSANVFPLPQDVRSLGLVPLRLPFPQALNSDIPRRLE